MIVHPKALCSHSLRPIPNFRRIVVRISARIGSCSRLTILTMFNILLLIHLADGNLPTIAVGQRQYSLVGTGL